MIVILTRTVPEAHPWSRLLQCASQYPGFVISLPDAAAPSPRVIDANPARHLDRPLCRVSM